MGKKKTKKKTPKAAKANPGECKITPSDSSELPLEKTSTTGEDKTSPDDNEQSPEINKNEIQRQEEPQTEQTREESEKFHLSAVEERIKHDINTRGRLRRMLPDIISVALALTVVGIGVAIWWKPPLLRSTFPVTTFTYKNQPAEKATLYRPLAMQERYYVKLPEKLENRYEWFAIDRRREVVALTKEPEHTFFGKTSIKRGDPLGLDLEFRKIDGHEWLIFFYSDAIVFSNNLLCVRLDTKKEEEE